MKLIISAIAVLLVALAMNAATNAASAQSDRTLGVTCTVAGHEHCGENGVVGGTYHRTHHAIRHWRRTSRND